MSKRMVGILVVLFGLLIASLAGLFLYDHNDWEAWVFITAGAAVMARGVYFLAQNW